MKRLLGVIFAFALTCTPAFGPVLEPDAVFARGVDVGPGLCCVVKMPGDHYRVYDAGDYPRQGEIAFDGIARIVPQGQPIDLLRPDCEMTAHIGGEGRGCYPRVDWNGKSCSVTCSACI